MSVRMAEKVGVNIMTMTTTFVTNTVFNMLFKIVNERGLSPDYLNEQRKIIEDGLFTWVAEQTLIVLYLEIFGASASNALERFEFQFTYLADPTMEVEQPPIEEVKALCGALRNLPPGSKYRVVVDLKEGASKVPGWSPTTLRDLKVTKETSATGWGFGNVGIAMVYKGGDW